MVITKYQNKNKLLIQEIYDLIPSELNAQNKRFILKKLNAKTRFFQYETSFAWLKVVLGHLFIMLIILHSHCLLVKREAYLNYF